MSFCFQTLFPGLSGILLGAGDLGLPIPTFSMEVPRASSMRLGVDVLKHPGKKGELR